MKDFLKIWISEKRDIFLVPLEVTEKYLFFPAKAWFEARYFIIFLYICMFILLSNPYYLFILLTYIFFCDIIINRADLYFMNLYIGNLSYNVKESDLRNVMEEYGTVASVKLITDRETRRSKGFAFVEMPDDAEANNVIKQLNGAEYVGRSMVVKEALPKN